MSIFEFISVAVSIVLGLSLAQMLVRVSQFAGNPTGIRFYLPHTFWMINLTLLHFLMWWSFWDYRNVEWNYGRFITIALEPLVLFLVTSIVVPSLSASESVDLREHFHRVRHWFFGSFLILEGLFMLDGPLVFFSEPLWTDYRLAQLTVIAAFALGIAVRRDWAQHLSVWIVMANMLWASSVRFMPGAFD